MRAAEVLQGRLCIKDRLTDHIGVIGINEYFGWYEPDFSTHRLQTSR